MLITITFSVFSGELGCVCNKPGSCVFEGFTVGYHPRSWEIVYNGMTQYGDEKAYKDYRSCPLSMLNIWTDIFYNPYIINIIITFHVFFSRKSLPLFIAALIRTRVVFLLRPVWGLLCLAPRHQGVHRQLRLQRQTARDDPYEVQLTIPVEGYDPIQFSLTKMCESKQNEAGTSSKGWALFGIFSCM
ncbi:hypothetical protein HanXRQr2_Chr16g0725091 [Helianthus annuus]|uniref:Uncharacterized protein n=1 Tax=Helianthus annuus TaxID=4232 RepID=A0A9K3GX22_HELAN|nr:hypothetical protein HanXRQr2_Chr16g0725091 [Helianthus annuus]KAJ0819370.1 hypothetical protein HanPSC8_Chr16g0695271 [Helianthus annuus]